MEVTLLIEAMDSSLSLLEDARKQAIELLDTTVNLTSETRSMEKKNIQAIFKDVRETKFGARNFFLTFILLFGFWILLSGKFDFFHIGLGIICTTLIAGLTHNLLFANVRIGNPFVRMQRFFSYAPWLFNQIVKSNFHVAYLALSPKLPIDPQIIRFSTKLESDIAWITLANSITLTPGTITIDIMNGEFIVHAIDQKVADDLNAGEMEDRVAHLFMEADHIYVQDVLDVATMFEKLKEGF